MIPSEHLDRLIYEVRGQKVMLDADLTQICDVETRVLKQAVRRNLPLAKCKHTIFNLVATFNDFEKRFGLFLDGCRDIARFASLGTTEQESGTEFRVDYLKPSGAIGFYYPDWVAVQKTKDGEVNWIIETKGRVWESTPAKDAAIDDWCRKVSVQTGTSWRYTRIDQTLFGTGNFATFAELLNASSAAESRE